MQAIIHYRNNRVLVLVKDIDNLSVAPKQGLVIEFKQEKAVKYFVEKLEKTKTPFTINGSKVISISSTGITVFND